MKNHLHLEIRVPVQVSFGDGRIGWDWHIEMNEPFSPIELEVVRSRIGDDLVSLTFRSSNSKSLVMSVSRDPKVSHGRAWGASFRAMLLLEKLLGPIRAIEDVPRDNWKLNFVVTEAVGDLEKDKTPLMIAC